MAVFLAELALVHYDRADILAFQDRFDALFVPGTRTLWVFMQEQSATFDLFCIELTYEFHVSACISEPLPECSDVFVLVQALPS